MNKTSPLQLAASSVLDSCTASPSRLAANTARPSPHGTRILYAEDDVPLRDLYRMVLAGAGYSVLGVSDGVEAWAAMEAQDFDLVITDHNMPHCSGYELVTKMRADGMGLPVIVTTSCVERFLGPENAALCISAVLDKPFTPRALHDTVTMVLWGSDALGTTASAIIRLKDLTPALQETA